MEHRCSVRKVIGFQLLLYKHGLPIQSGTCINMGLGGMLIDTGDRQWRKNEYLEVEILGQAGDAAMRLPAVVVHQTPMGVGVMFDAVTNEQRRTLRAWLFGRSEQKSAATEIARAVA
jgi:PilZ domain